MLLGRAADLAEELLESGMRHLPVELKVLIPALIGRPDGLLAISVAHLRAISQLVQLLHGLVDAEFVGLGEARALLVLITADYYFY